MYSLNWKKAIYYTGSIPVTPITDYNLYNQKTIHSQEKR
nr:MAG TPA_asm: hypothetical protein [Caudoviricetes sp.]